MRPLQRVAHHSSWISGPWVSDALGLVALRQGLVLGGAHSGHCQFVIPSILARHKVQPLWLA